MNESVRVRISVSGHVQGVGYRYETVRTARRLGLAGWVRNTADGRVEIVAEGPEPAVKQLVDWCRSGPPGARVTSVQHAPDTSTESLSGFEVRY